MNIDIAAKTASVSTSGRDHLTPTQNQKILESAVQFEALLLGQLMKSAHDASFGDAALGEDQASGSLMEVATQEFSQLLAERGGLGLAKLIQQGLQAKMERHE